MNESSIWVQIRAIKGKRWAAHRALGPRDTASWVVTHIKTGMTFPPRMFGELTLDEAVAVASALDESGIDGLSASDAKLNAPWMHPIEAIAAAAIAEVSDV